MVGSGLDLCEEGSEYSSRSEHNSDTNFGADSLDLLTYSSDIGDGGDCFGVIEQDHRIDWDQSTVIDREQQWHRRRLKEAIHIRTHNNFRGLQ
ncbi:MAG: hypothetical protein MJE68_12480 [Proteobacteria bacterium]|nr:hypothetical protein [Pseudomonadota bacterium]